MIEKPVVFKNSKGMQLVGMLHIPKGKGKFSAVIICHGFGGNKVDMYRVHVRIARAICKAGFLVLRFDFHGHGDSEGEFRDFRVTQEFDDLRCAMNLIKKQKNFNGKIGLVGHSLGGTIALITAAKNKDISAVVALAPVTNWRQIKFLNEIVEAEMKGVVERRSDILSKDVILDMTKHNPIDRVNEISCPVLIVHGTKDDSISLKGSREFIQKLKAPKKLVVIGGADHCFEGYSNTMTMIKETVSWMKKYI